MKCPKCGHDNPEKTPFCEECDWKMDQPVRREMAAPPPFYTAITAAILGIVSVILWYAGIAYGAVGLGAVGLMLGSYSMTAGRRIGGEKKMLIVAIACVAVLASVIGFLLGIYDL